ncbi:leukocyte elastase inhibitor-like [Dunckerocampus dactyliophorus]|uniref:leukocyte elastase inhibitor-like n=1 Tax=Dunckerocampus dactyliophorus TaxID=161453 RepID=UPI00240491D5|nr:leukocyte elastase inhibitor-like [Dunckerocampus dactyliophorus]
MASGTPKTEANVTFSLALFEKLSEEDKTASVFFSPFSISAALAMTLLGARGNTAAQMLEVLGFTKPKPPTMPEQVEQQRQSPMQMQMQTRQRIKMQMQISKLPHYLKEVLGESQDEVHTHFKQLLTEFNEPNSKYSLSIANRLYGEKTYDFVEDFLDLTRKYYLAELESVDFKENVEEARVNINKWVEANTQDKIQEILAKDKVPDTTKLLLVNAIYFKGNWNKQFKEENTVDAPFRINKNETKPVKMMYQKGKFPLKFIEELNSQILEMPYKGKVLSMLIFLPNQIEDNTTGLEKLKRNLSYATITEWTRSDVMTEVEVQVGLPRFKMEATYELDKVLPSMGMVDAFDSSRSNFSGMSPNNDLLVSKVIHKAFVEVNEEGTEAAAATTVIVVERTSVISNTFIADHPFLFFIRHNPTNTILFAGQYSSPE